MELYRLSYKVMRFLHQKLISFKYLSYLEIQEALIYKNIDDFDISKTPEENWPECDFCLTKLHRRDINADEFKEYIFILLFS